MWPKPVLQTAHRPDLGMGPLSALIRRESSHLGSISALPADLSHLWQNCQFLLLSLLFLCSGRTLTFLLGKQPCLQLGMAMYPSSCPRPSTEAQPLGNSCKKKGAWPSLLHPSCWLECRCNGWNFHNHERNREVKIPGPGASCPLALAFSMLFWTSGHNDTQY